MRDDVLLPASKHDRQSIRLFANLPDMPSEPSWRLPVVPAPRPQLNWALNWRSRGGGRDDSDGLVRGIGLYRLRDSEGETDKELAPELRTKKALEDMADCMSP